MSIFIKAGLWVEKRFGNKGEFNLTHYIQQNGGSGVTSVTATSPVTSSGGTTPVIAIPAASSLVPGYLTADDWNTFNNKLNTLSGTGIVKSTAGVISYVNGTSSQLVQGDGSLFDKFHQSINASEEVSTTSLTDEVVTGMTITPPAGTYKVDFNGNYDVIPGNVCTIATLDLQNMYLALLNTPATGTHGLTFGSGETITPGVYTVSGAMSVAGILTLDGGGDPNALFIFRVTGAINTAIATTIQLTNSANAANVFFMAIGAVGIGADNVVSGNFIAYGAAAALGANCIFNGRLFSTSGALAFSSGIQSKPTAISVINMGILENFLCFTNQGNVANTALAVITGDMGTNFGNVTIFATSVFNGNAYDDTQQLGSTNVFSIYNDTTMVPNSSRLRRYYTYTEDVALTCVTTVDGTQAISINWRTDVGRCILNNRILTIVKL
jgi:hypothetical protein